jgi:chromosome segregation ATPase
MPGYPKLSPALSTTTLATLLSLLALPGMAMAGIELSSTGSATYGDKMIATQSQYGREVLIRTDIDVTDLRKMREKLDDHGRQLEELKRSSGSNSSSSNKEIDELKRTVKEQERDLDNQRKQIEELKRSSGSSSSSSNSEISSLKQKVSDQDRAIDQLKRTVEDLSRKVK